MPSGTSALLDMLKSSLMLVDAGDFFVKGKVFADAIGKYIIGDFTYKDVQQYLN